MDGSINTVSRPALSEAALTESASVRAATVDRIEVLDKVGTLATAPDGEHATTEMVAAFYEVDLETVRKLVQRHREELTGNGLRVLRGAALRDFERDTLSLSIAEPPGKGGRRSLALFTRRTVLNAGQLLTGSEVARQVRTYLLEVEAGATAPRRLAAAERSAIDRATETRFQLEAFEVAKRGGLVNDSFTEAKVRQLLARMIGEEPQFDDQDITITCDDFLKEHGVAVRDLKSARSRLGRAVAVRYRLRYQGRQPQLGRRLVDDVHREVYVYTRRDLDLFEDAWAGICHLYDVQPPLAE